MTKMKILRFLIIPVSDKDLIRDPSIIKWCRYPYKPTGKYKGCPNSLGPGESCQTEYIDDIATGPWWFVAAVCDFAKYRKEVKRLHPGWSERQLRNPLYWQGNIRKRLRAHTLRVMKDISGKGFFYTQVPEGYGVNVIETLENLGYDIPRYPEETVWKVNLIAKKKD